MEMEIQISRQTVKKAISICLALLIAMSSLWSGLAMVGSAFDASKVYLSGSGDILTGESKRVTVYGDRITYLEFVPAYSGVYRFYSTANEDTYGYLYDADKNQLASDDDSGNNGDFLIKYELEADKKYYWGVRFYYSGTSGFFHVTLDCIEILCYHENTVEVAENKQCYTNGNAAGTMCLDCGRWVSGGDTIKPAHVDENGDGACEICEKTMPVTTGNCGGSWIWDDEWECDIWEDTVKYYLYSDGTLEIFGSGEIEDYAFYWREDIGDAIKNVIIYDGITSIGNVAFEGLENLESAVMADTVTEIGDWLFSHCYNLKSVKLSANLKVIPEYTFYDCSLESIEIPDSVTAIREKAFAGCAGLKSVEIPDSVVTVGNAAFESSGLEAVKVSSKLKALPTNIFSNCYNLKSIELPENITFIDNDALSYCYNLEGITILNEKCKFSSKCGIDQDAIIYGYWGSTADDFAYENSIRFRGYCAHENTENVAGVEASCYTYGHNAGAKCLDCGRWASGGEMIPASHIDEDKDKICDRCEKNMPIFNIFCGGNKEYVNERTYYDNKARAYAYDDGTLEIFGEGTVWVLYWPNGQFYDSVIDTKKIIINEGITEIEENGFRNFVYLEEVTMAASVRSVRRNALENCIRLSKITVLNPNCHITFDRNVFPETAVIYGYSGSSAEKYATDWIRKFVPLDKEHDHEFESKVTLKPSCTSTGIETFTCYCGETYTEVVVPNSHFDFDFDGNCDVCGTNLNAGVNDLPTDDNVEEEKNIFASFFESIINFFKNLMNIFNFFKQ